MINNFGRVFETNDVHVQCHSMVIIRPEKKAHANGSEAVAVLTALDVSTICHMYKSVHV